jgi:LEA14-like dessication related protein
MRYLLALFALLLLLAGCSKPQPPTLKPQRAEIVSTGATALVVRVHCMAFNPNSFPLPVRNVDAALALAGSPLGTVTAGTLPTLAAKVDTPVVFELSVPWTNVAPAVLASPPGDELPYSVQGTAHFEAAGIKFSSDFRTDASIRKSELLAAALRSVPLPGLPGLPLPR